MAIELSIGTQKMLTIALAGNGKTMDVVQGFYGVVTHQKNATAGMVGLLFISNLVFMLLIQVALLFPRT